MNDHPRALIPRFAPHEIPQRMRSLPFDRRGFPVPWFVQWFDHGKPSGSGLGEPDFRVVDTRNLGMAIKHKRCWLCGQSLGTFKCFVIGPMCAVNRINSEPPSHYDCAEFAMSACPFLSRPTMRRNEKGIPAGTVDAAGFPLGRNPGVMCLWTTKSYRPFSAEIGKPGILFELGEPTNVEWFTQGRLARSAEVQHALATGLPALREMAERDGPDGVAELARCIARVESLLPTDDTQR